MNIKNLQAIADLCRTIPQEKFNMMRYRKGDCITPECNSVGCVLGHSTVLDSGTLPRHSDGNINFELWGERFTGLRDNSPESRWCFGGFWWGCDNSPIGAAKRIEYLLAGKELPDMTSAHTADMVTMYS
jgi:hypothetical protein